MSCDDCYYSLSPYNAYFGEVSVRTADLDKPIQTSTGPCDRFTDDPKESGSLWSRIVFLVKRHFEVFSQRHFPTVENLEEKMQPMNPPPTEEGFTVWLNTKVAGLGKRILDWVRSHAFFTPGERSKVPF